MSFEIKLRGIHFFNHLMLIPAFVYGEWWMWIMAYLWWAVIGSIGISAGFHRYLSHKAYRTYGWFEKFSLAIGCLATGGTPLGWAGAHRMHHAYADTELDPHSPIKRAWWKIYVHDWGHVKIQRKFIKDLLRNKTVMWLHNHYFKILIVWAMGLALIHPLLGIFGYCIPAVMAFHAYGQINAWGHMWGYRRYNTDDHSYNNPVVNILTMGEGWHNNHHNTPRSWKIGETWWEWDPAAFILSTFNLTKRGKN